MVWGECWDLFFFCIFYSLIEWLSLTPVKNHLVPVARSKLLCQFYHNLAPFYLSKEERQEGRNGVACLLCARYRAKHFMSLFSFNSTTRLWVGILIIFWKRILASEILEGLSMVTYLGSGEVKIWSLSDSKTLCYCTKLIPPAPQCSPLFGRFIFIDT